MRKFITVLFYAFTALMTTASFGQDAEKKVVAVTPFSSAGTFTARAYANSLTETVINSVVKVNRFKVVDRTSFDAILTEDNLQKGENFMDGLVVEQGKKMGAQYIITGNLKSASAEETYTTDSNGRRTLSGYIGRLSYSIKIIDVVTGEILATELMGNSSGTALWILNISYGTQEEAISKAIQEADRDMQRILDKYFPVTMKIFEITEEKKGVARKLVVTGGSDSGLKIGQDLRVVEVTKVELNGKMVDRNRIVGMLTIASVDDANFSTCKVRKEGKEIYEKFKSGANLMVISGQ